jgi:Zn-dependent protease with chaperone function
MPDAVSAAFYDGDRAQRHAVVVRFGDNALDIAQDGAVLARWSYEDIRRQDGPPEVLRLRSLGAPELARLEIDDAAAAAEVIRRCPRLDEATRTGRRTARRIVVWSLAAGLSLLLTAVYLVPIASDWLAPLVPWSVERRLGGAVDNQVRILFGKTACTGAGGRAALDKLGDRLSAEAKLPAPIEIGVLPSPVPNALALPGGRIYLLEGLLRRAENVDEIAGVLAHEMGHIRHRDGLRRLIQSGGTAFLLGLLFGDVTGSGTLILLGRVLLESSYSRDAETAADRFAGDIMIALGRSPAALGSFLVRVTGTQRDHPLPFLANHPVSADRLAALRARDVPSTGPALLTDEEWRALKSICRPA